MSTEIRKAPNDSIRILKMFDLAFFFLDVKEMKESADSISETAIRIAEMSYKPGLLLLAYTRFLESNDNIAYYNTALGYATKALQMCRIAPGPSISARVTVLLPCRVMQGEIFQPRPSSRAEDSPAPVRALPPPPLAPSGFSALIERETALESRARLPRLIPKPLN